MNSNYKPPRMYRWLLKPDGINVAPLIRIWCWVIGHDWICLKRHTHLRDDQPWTTTSAFHCTRCKTQITEQWDE